MVDAEGEVAVVEEDLHLHLEAVDGLEAGAVVLRPAPILDSSGEPIQDSAQNTAMEAILTLDTV